MMIRRRSEVLLVAALASALVLVGCTGSDDPPESPRASGGEPSAAPPTQRNTSRGAEGLVLVDPSTGESVPVPVGEGDPRQAELSPTGATIAYQDLSDEGVPQVFLIDGDGAIRQLTDLRGGAWEPTWSPNGSRIAFAGAMLEAGDTDIYVVEAGSGDVHVLARTPLHDRAPDWSPDGSSVVFHAETGTGGDVDQSAAAIWSAPLDGRGLSRLSRKGPWADENPAWSPDGRWIAFTRFGPDTRNGIPYAKVWLMRADGARQHPIGEDNLLRSGWRFREPSPTWSPDGSSVAYSLTGCSCINVVDVRSSEATTLSVIPHDPPEWCTPGPRWCRSGPRRLLGPSWTSEGILACSGCVQDRMREIS